MLGELGMEQFEITIRRDEKEVSKLRIHDPFIRTSIRIGISRWDLFKALFRKQFETKITVSVDGTDGMVRTIMMLDPEVIAKETEKMQRERAERRANSATIGYVAEHDGAL